MQSRHGPGKPSLCSLCPLINTVQNEGLGQLLPVSQQLLSRYSFWLTTGLQQPGPFSHSL